MFKPLTVAVPCAGRLPREIALTSPDMFGGKLLLLLFLLTV